MLNKNSANPFLLFLAISQKPALSLSDIDLLNVVRPRLESTLATLAAAEVTLENLAEDMNLGNVEYYGDTKQIKSQAEALTQLRNHISAFLNTFNSSTQLESNGGGYVKRE